MKRPALAYIVGAYEHPTRKAPDKSVGQLHAEVAIGARLCSDHAAPSGGSRLRE